MTKNSDVKDLRNLFWQKYEGKITFFEMQEGVKRIMDRQTSFKFNGGNLRREGERVWKKPRI